MSQPRKNRFRALALLGAVGASGVVASLFSPARDHGIIDVVPIAAASSAYALLTASIALTKPPRTVTRWFGGADEARRAERWAFLASGASAAVYVVTIWFPVIQTLRRLDPDGPHVPTVPAAIIAAFGLGFLLLIRLDERLRSRCGRLMTPLTVTVFLAATIQFATAAKLLVTLTSPHGAYMITVAGVGVAALLRLAFTKNTRQTCRE
ncbi:hypothetical protein [Leucobacter sp. M11]|uniref:hypothetical protein n=1 Tax=Leucobacter sp. M11 TaxID=2993565 RepID=UPI002D80D26B|nr:hypothetical protein [Leucobacter sp. M11]MEB4614436.1 hypothetical protein [Leucobacter sp. M11]